MENPAEPLGPPTAASQAHGWRSLAVLLTVVLGTLASIGVFLMIGSWEYQVADISFQTTARDRLRIIATDFTESSRLLYTLRAYMEAAKSPISREEFVWFSHTLHNEIAGLRDTGWAPRVTAAERAEFERRLQTTGFPGFQITERAADGGLTRAGERPDYFPLLFSEGDPQSSRILGLDVGYEPTRRSAITHTLRTHEPAATPPTTLVTKNGQKGGLMSYLAVGDVGAGLPGATQAAPPGVVLGAFDVVTMIDNIVAAKVSLNDVDVYFFEPGAALDDPAIYARLSQPDDPRAPTKRALLQQTNLSGTVPIMDQPWTAIFTPAQPLHQISWQWHATMPLVIGLTMTAMIATYLVISLRRTVQLEALTTGLRLTTDDLRRNMAKVTHMAGHDLLTGLPNRALFKESLDNAVARLALGLPFALLCMDLDRFKAVNDTLGHAAGDQLLREVATRMRIDLRQVDTLARLGGDEFAMILADMPTADSAAAIARRLVESVSRPYDIHGSTVSIGVSVGIAVAPGDGRTAEPLQIRADLALYAAKDAGRGTVRCFDEQLSAEVETRRLLEADLGRALALGELELHYQPIVSLELQRVVGLEALARWRHPTRGLIMPDRFITLAEECGLILPLGRWALLQACTDAARWPAPVFVAVNVSALQLRAPGFDGEVRQALANSGLPPHRLEIEITESAVLGANDITVSALSALRDLGVQIAFDDFGTGFSSLSSLHRYPIDRIKVDKSFIADLEVKPSAGAIVQAMVGLGCSLGLATTGEGIETPAQNAALRALGCTHGQGFLFGRPRPNHDVPEMLHLEGQPSFS